MKKEAVGKNRRILLIDDNPSIHADFLKILVGGEVRDGGLGDVEVELFGGVKGRGERQVFELTSAHQGQEGLEKVACALNAGTPFAVAFVDVRMPPGWDGIETIGKLWGVDPDLQVVICTAYADYSWEEMIGRLGVSDRLVILKKPFDSIEVQQLANSLTEKWNLLQQSKSRMSDLEAAIGERTRELKESNDHLRTEIQERKATELALRATQQKLNHFLSKNPAVLFSMFNASGSFVPAWVSDNVTQLTGGSIEDWYEQTPTLDYVEEADKANLLRSLAKLLTEGQMSVQYRLNVKGGATRWIRDDRRLMRDTAGRPVEVVGCWTDITEQRKLEDQLRQAQKMESVGHLAGGVAHDFNNLLMVILGHVEMLINYEQLPKSAVESLQRVQAAAERAGNLTRQLLAFSRKQIMRPQAVNLNEVITAISKLLERTLGEHIAVTTQCREDLPAVLADRGMLEQIIMNLAVNARDAMPDGGQIVISTCQREIDTTYQRKHPDAHAGRFVCLSVADNGTGIAENILPRIFEPFFTTKEVGKGTGLGLATVYGNVKQHNGWVEVESEMGHGTTFKIYLPVTERSALSNDTSVVGRSVKGGTETILVVEDEPALCGLISISLQRQGYKVHTASSGAEALAVWSARLDEIDLLFTDVVMPDGLNGWELAKEFLAVKPLLKVIYMSGYNTDTTNGRLESDKDIFFLEKPFSPQKLAQTVRICLDTVPSIQFKPTLITERN